MRAKHGKPVEWLKDRISATNDTCLIWPFGKSHGYGTVRYSGRTWNAHRLMCILAHGKAPIGCTDVAHRCGNKLCCNPKHLRHSTAIENQHDKYNHGTMLRGEDHPAAKLNLGQVQEIRAAFSAGRTQSELARQYAVSASTIKLIANRVNWAWAA